MHYCWWKFPLWHYRTLHSGNSSVEISTDIPEHSVNVWINPPICLHGVDVSTSQWINPPGNAVKCINPLPIFIFHHLVDIYINLGTSVGYTTLLYQVPPSSGIVHSYSTLCSDSVRAIIEHVIRFGPHRSPHSLATPLASGVPGPQFWVAMNGHPRPSLTLRAAPAIGPRYVRRRRKGQAIMLRAQSVLGGLGLHGAWAWNLETCIDNPITLRCLTCAFLLLNSCSKLSLLSTTSLC